MAERLNASALKTDVPNTPTRVGRAAYIDPNLKNFGHLVDSDGNSIEFSLVEELRGMEKTCDKLRRKRDRCVRRQHKKEFVREDGSVHVHWEASRRWTRFDKALKRTEERMRELKKHHMFTLSNWLCREYDLIGVGDYAPENVDHGRGRKANRKIRNRTYLSQFRSTLLWVARRSGKRAEVRDERGTTRTCNPCKEVVEGGLSPEIREWTCANCGVHHLRDENSSCNGLEGMLLGSKTLRNLQMPRSGHGALHRSTWSFRPGGRWEVANVSPGPCNEMGRPLAQGRLLEATGPEQGRDSRRPKLKLGQ